MPKPEHVETLARALHDRLCGCCEVGPCQEADWDKGDIWHTHSASILSAIAEPGQAQDAVLTALVEGGRLTFEVKWDPCSAAEHGHEDFEVCFHASDIRSRLIEPEWRQDAP